MPPYTFDRVEAPQDARSERLGFRGLGFQGLGVQGLGFRVRV